MARNVDFCGGASVPFTQYLRPDGRTIAQWIDVASDGIDQVVVAKAREIVAAGFFLTMEHLDTWPRQASFAISDDYGDYAAAVCVNGPAVPRTVREMILAADIGELCEMASAAALVSA